MARGKNIAAAWGDAHRFSPAPRHRRRILLSILNKLTFESCVDVGCAQPYLLEILHTQGKQAHGCDISDEIIGANRKHFPGIQFDELDIAREAYPGGKKFDVVISSEVIEHVQDWQPALSNLMRMSGRYLLLTVPTGRLYEMDRLVGHLRHYTLADLGQEIEKNGFKVIFYKYWGMPFHTLYKYLINACGPRTIYAQFAEAKFGMKEKALSLGLYGLFFLNDLFHSGSQLFILAKRSE